VKRLFEDVCQRQQTWHWWPYPSPTTRSRCWNAFHFPDFPGNIPAERIFPGGDVLFIAEYWLEANRAIWHFFQTISPPARIEVAEESLVTIPGQNLASIAAKLEIPLKDIDSIGDSCDLSRNQQWRDLLDDNDRDCLRGFVRMHAQEIDMIFPNGQYASRYLAILR
jgi:hypothetical protein